MVLVMVMTDEETTGAMAAGTTGMETEVGNRYQHPTDEPLTADRLVSQYHGISCCGQRRVARFSRVVHLLFGQYVSVLAVRFVSGSAVLLLNVAVLLLNVAAVLLVVAAVFDARLYRSVWPQIAAAAAAALTGGTTDTATEVRIQSVLSQA